MYKRKMTLEKGEIIPLSFDYVFTSIFNNPENIMILENFLCCYFEIPLIEIRGKIKLLPRELELESKVVANKQIDLIIELNGEKINIELSNYGTNGIINRNIVYACNIHGRQLKYGHKSYNKIERTIQINLNNYHKNKQLKETYYLRNDEGKILSQKFQIDNVDMVLGTKMCYTENETKLARWCMVFTSKTKEDFERALGGNLMEEAAREKLVDEVNKYSGDEEVVALYSKYTREELERNTFWDDMEQLKKQLDREIILLEEEKNTLKKEQDTLKKEQNTLKEEQDTLKEEQDTLKEEQDTLKEEQNTLKKEKNILEQEKSFLEKEEKRIQSQEKRLKEEKQNMIKEMLAEGIEISLISKITGVTFEEIQTIKEKNLQ